MKTQSKSLTLRITEVEGNMYQLNYSRRYRMANSRGYNWISGWERFIFDNGNISWRSEEDLQDLLRKVAMSKKSLLEYITQSI